MRCAYQMQHFSESLSFSFLMFKVLRLRSTTPPFFCLLFANLGYPRYGRPLFLSDLDRATMSAQRGALDFFYSFSKIEVDFSLFVHACVSGIVLTRRGLEMGSGEPGWRGSSWGRYCRWKMEKHLLSILKSIHLSKGSWECCVHSID